MKVKNHVGRLKIKIQEHTVKHLLMEKRAVGRLRTETNVPCVRQNRSKSEKILFRKVKLQQT